MVRIIIIVFALAVSAWHTSAQSVMLKTNLLYTGATLTPNLGAEIRLGDRTTLDFWGSYNPWNLEGRNESNKKLVHWMSQVELRYWPCRSFDGHFFGLHLLTSQYNIGQKNLDFILGNESEKYRFQGYGLGGGISYGYQWLLSKNWSLSANVGIGLAFLNHERYESRHGGKLKDKENMTYIGPTRLGINLIYFIK